LLNCLKNVFNSDFGWGFTAWISWFFKIPSKEEMFNGIAFSTISISGIGTEVK
jgi:hypothetical protein